MSEKILAINPGSTSTKVALFDGEALIFKQTVSHDAEVLKTFKHVSDQLEYRKETILHVLAQQNIDIHDCSAFAGRGGGLAPCTGGVYEINDLVLEDAKSAKYADHPANLGSQIAHELAVLYHAKSFIVNPPVVDEFQDVARVTGLRDVTRRSNTHALNQKETAQRVSQELGLDYLKSNYIVAHIGGGVSVTAHQQGRMIDSNDNLNGDGPMAPTRTGALPAKDVLDLCFSGKWSYKELYEKLTKTGGFVDHLGTSETLDVVSRIQGGDTYAKLVYEAFQYQIGKQIGAMAAVLKGKVDAIILTGGIANDEGLVKNLKEMIGFLGPVVVKAGEFEMEALAYGVLRVLRGEDQPLQYNGLSVFSGFKH